MNPNVRKILASSLLWLSFLLCQGFAAAPQAEAQGAPPGQDLIISPEKVVEVQTLPPTAPELPRLREIPLRVPDPDLLRQRKQELEQERLPTLKAPQAVPSEPALGPTVATSFIGLRRSESGGAIPPDTQVAAGPDHLFEVVNIEGRILTKTGAVVSTFTLNAFFGLPGSTFLFDPRIRFDPASGRWFIVMATDQNTFGTWRLAVSTSSDPAGSFVIYSIPTPGSLPDFPAIGISDDKVILTANAFRCTISCNGAFLGTEFLVLNKAQLVAGTSVNATFFPPPQGLFNIQPAHSLSSTTTHYMAAVAFFSATTIRIWSVTGVPGVGPGVSATTVDQAIASLSVPPDAEQMGTSALIATNDNGLLDAVYRGGALWVTANAACIPGGDSITRACLRFIQVLTGSLVVGQDFNFGTPGVHHYYAAIQTDSGNNLVAVFSRSSSSEFASVYASGQLTTDPPNTLQAPVLIKAGEAPYDPLLVGFTQRRWGDYSGASVDPSDQTIVWVAGEYARAEGGAEWGTWIAQLRFALVLGLSLNQNAFGPGSTLAVSITVANFGPLAVADVYFGLLVPSQAGAAFGCPAGDAIILLADGFARVVFTCLSASPPGFAPLLQNVSIPAALPATAFPNFFSFVWPSGAPAGIYTFFMVFTRAGSLEVIAVATASASFAQ